MRSTRSRTHGSRRGIVSSAESMLSDDQVTSRYAGMLANTFDELLQGCSLSDGKTDEYTFALVRGVMEFKGDDADADGDVYEQASGICQKAIDGHVLRLDDASKNEVITGIADGVYKSALNKQHEFEMLHDAGVTQGVVLSDSLGYGSLGEASYDMDTETTRVSLNDGRTYVNSWDAYQCYYRLRAVKKSGNPRAIMLASSRVSSGAF